MRCAARVVRVSRDPSRSTGRRADAFCGACGAPMSRFARECHRCGCRALLPDETRRTDGKGEEAGLL